MAKAKQQPRVPIKVKALLASFAVASICFGVYRFWSNRRPPELSPITQGLDVLEKNGLPDITVETLPVTPSSNTVSKDKPADSTSPNNPNSQESLRSISKNTATVVNFWASWCEPCAREIPSMLRLMNEFKGQISFIAISADENLEDAQRFVKTFNLRDHPNVYLFWDKDGKARAAFGVKSLPESFLFHKNQSFVRKVIGVDQWYTPQSIEFVRVEMLSN